ncbi:MAG TPA: 50S ribosomal protein L17 [Phycisphaerae bacterium]|jgi:large subunit ribosomal protein L17|nr:50S ribosomal protein L17 [Phycisphaerae bacterium]HPM24221.1 50S ribosomal protein L17 [Phycisphaerae bacterium]
MRHRVRGRKLNRTASHRLALRRNLCQSLFEHGEVRTTLVKAKEVRSFAERLVTLAVAGDLSARQRAERLLQDRAVIPKDNQDDYDRMSDAKRLKTLRARSGRRHRVNTTRPGLKFSAESVLHKLFAEIGPRMKKRNEARQCSGGYTRIIKLADRRLGDAGPLAILQLVGEEDKPRPRSKDKTERKRRARVKYTVYAGKPRPHPGRRRSTKAPAKPAAGAEKEGAAE